MDHTPAAVAIAWAMARPGIASVLLGASKLEQLHGNLAALEVGLTPEQLSRLNESSAPETFFTPEIQRSIFGRDRPRVAVGRPMKGRRQLFRSSRVARCSMSCPNLP